MFEKFRSFFKSTPLKKAIVYYGKNISYEKIRNIDYVIVQSAYIDTSDKIFLNSNDNIYAYVSVGEISKQLKEYSKIKQEWIVGKNGEWDSDILDITNKEYQKFVLKEIIEPILNSGFKNLFFDTLDSYQLANPKKREKQVCELALVQFFKKLNKTYPNTKIIINRGFEIVDKISNFVDAVLFESYHFRLGGKEETYTEVSDNDKEWLDLQVNKVKKMGIDVIALDYLNEKDMYRAYEAIEVIRSKGMIPYISTRALDKYGEYV